MGSERNSLEVARFAVLWQGAIIEPFGPLQQCSARDGKSSTLRKTARRALTDQHENKFLFKNTFESKIEIRLNR